MFPAVITALAFILTFVVVGLVVVAAAFSGGRRNTERPAGPSRRGRRSVALLVGALVLLLGVLVPALVIAAGKTTQKAPGGVELTAAEEGGRPGRPTSAAARSSPSAGPPATRWLRRTPLARSGRTWISCAPRRRSSSTRSRRAVLAGRHRSPPASSTARTPRMSPGSSGRSPATSQLSLAPAAAQGRREMSR